MKTLEKLSFAIVAAAIASLVALAVPAGAEQFAVPLSKPGEPVTLELELISGGATVEAYDGQEVIVEVRLPEIDDEHESKHRSQRNGLRQIPNTSHGLTIEEERNEVRIEVESWNKAIHLDIKVPVRTSLHLETVNGGDLVVRGVEGDHELANTNGSITARDIAGSLVAETVNGDLTVTFRSLAQKPMAFSTLNGDVDVTFPSNLAAELRMRSDHGEIFTDFELQLEKSPARVTQERGSGYRVEVRKEVIGKVGGGGPEMAFKTFNGDILIRKK